MISIGAFFYPSLPGPSSFYLKCTPNWKVKNQYLGLLAAAKLMVCKSIPHSTSKG